MHTIKSKAGMSLNALSISYIEKALGVIGHATDHIQDLDRCDLSGMESKAHESKLI